MNKVENIIEINIDEVEINESDFAHKETNEVGD